MRATCLGVLLALLAGPPAAYGGRPVPMTNPSFEQGAAEAPGPAGFDWQRKSPVPGWHAWIGSVARAGTPRIEWPAKGGHTGERCVALSGCIGAVCIIQAVPVRPGTPCEARVWTKASSPQPQCGLAVRFQSAERKWVTGTHRCLLPASAKAGEWVELRVLFTAPNDAAFALFLLTANGQKPEETCWFDDASLTAMEPGDLVVGGCGWIHPNCMPVGKPAETPHVPWARPWAGKRLRVLFLVGSDHNLREPIELAQRLDIDHDTAFAHSFEPMVYAFNDREIADRVQAGDYDVVVVGVNAPAVMLAKLSAQARGLVLIRCPRVRPKLPSAAQLAAVPVDHPLAEPLDALGPLDDKPRGGVAGLRVGTLGKARVVEVAYRRSTYCLTPTVSFDEQLELGGEHWEVYLQLLARAILHAGAAPAAVEAELGASDGAAVLRLVAGEARPAFVWVRFCDRVGGAYESRIEVGPKPPRELRIEPPQGHASGPSTVLASVRDAQRRSLGFAATRLEVQRPTRLGKIEVDRPWFAEGQPVQVAVVAAGALDGVRAEAALTDAHGRLHARAEAPCADGKARLALSHARKLSTFNWLTVRLLRGRDELDARRSYILAPTSRQAFLDDYQVGTWASSSYMSAYLHPTLHRLMREAGITLGIQHKAVYPSMLADGMRLISTGYGRIPGFSRHTSREPVRRQCVNDPAIRQRMAEAARQAAEEERGACPVLGYIRDETSLVKDDLDVDACACEHCVARYRDWLKARYGTLAKLNAHWHTACKAWDEVGFTTYKQVRGKDTFAPWVMFRRFQEWAWADAIAWCNRHAREGDPTAMLALPNTFGQKPFVGRDYWLLAQANAYTMEYPTETRSNAENRAVFDTLRTFNPATRHLPWMGYRFDESVIRFVPWWTAFHGASGSAVYGAMSFFAGKNSWAQIYPAIQHTRRGLMYAEELEELKGGIGKLLIAARRPVPDIAILWSQASMHVGWAMSDQTGNPGSLAKRNAYTQHFASRRAMRLAVLASGRQFDYVAEEQIRRGVLDRYTWLLMPGIYAVDDDVAERLERFVAAGGTVVADLGVGLTNEAGARLGGDTRLTRLFGFTRAGGEPDYDERQAPRATPAHTLGAELPAFVAIGRETLTARPGTLVADAGDGCPLFLTSRHGKGTAFFMNCRAPDAPALAPLLDSLPRLAALAYAKGAERPSGYELVRFELGANAFLGILRDWRAGGPDEPLAVALPSKSHVYDVRARKALGHTDRIACSLSLGGAALYALLPYRVEGVELRGPREAKAGQSHRVSCVVRGSAPPSDHVLHLDVRRPDGTTARHYRLNLVARGGRAEAEIPFALNDPPGRWTLVARDVASGVGGEQIVHVKPLETP